MEKISRIMCLDIANDMQLAAETGYLEGIPVALYFLIAAALTVAVVAGLVLAGVRVYRWLRARHVQDTNCELYVVKNSSDKEEAKADTTEAEARKAEAEARRAEAEARKAEAEARKAEAEARKAEAEARRVEVEARKAEAEARASAPQLTISSGTFDHCTISNGC